MSLKVAVLEIGCEEIPSSYIAPAMEQLRNAVTALLAEHRLAPTAVRLYSTPRRLTLLIEGLPERQEDVVLEVTGPPVSAAFDAQGKPTKAGEGFAKAQGVGIDALQRKAGPKGEVVSLVKKVAGRPTVEILSEIFPSAIKKLRFPKVMRWGDGDSLFARPIRWILAMLGPNPVPFEFADVASGRATYGLRVLKRGPLAVEDASRYLDILRGAGVLADPVERLEKTREAVLGSAAARKARLIEDEGLLKDVNNLIESPEAVSGGFDPVYLSLPSAVIVTAMREHQKFFAMTDDAGRLVPGFITVINGHRDRHDLIRQSNEAVLKARLEDAKFFWQEDMKVPLAQWAEKLSGITWLEGQGSLTDKAARVKTLASSLAGVAGVDAKVLEQAALLCKADLATNMVREKEFNSLQGVMGGLYAEAQGLGPAVARAIGEHYRPRWAGDELPNSSEGAVLSVADKLDTITGCYKAGLIPTGSQDPFALRRQALGVLLIVLGRRWPLSLEEWIGKALERVGGKPDPEMVKTIEAFIRGRLQTVLESRNLSYDAVNAVLATPSSGLVELVERAEAVHRLKPSPEFQSLATAAGRVLRILPDNQKQGSVSEGLFQTPEEGALWKAAQSARPAVEAASNAGDWDKVVRVLSGLEPAVHAFFDKVLVMDKDVKVKANRLALLASLADLYLVLCDFRKLVYASEGGSPAS